MEHRNGIIKGYKVNYRALPNSDILTAVLNITSQQQNEGQMVTLDKLNEFTNYSIRVLAFTVIGDGQESDAQVVKTLEDSKFYFSICAVFVTFSVFVAAFDHLISGPSSIFL